MKKMKKFMLFAQLALLGTFGFAQNINLPEVVQNSFNKVFPNQIISSWTDNSSYNYVEDWDNDQYFGDYNFDGYPDDFLYSNMYGINDGFTDDYYYYNDDYGYGYEYNIPDSYSQVIQVNPTQYQINFKYNGVKMASLFKNDGSFIIAKGRISRLPIKVKNATLNAFKGKTFRISHIKEEMITPYYTKSNPVYRFKVNIKHGGNHLLKVDSKGKIISNTEK
jgi:hypothetical protein